MGTSVSPCTEDERDAACSRQDLVAGRGLHSSTFQLNLSGLCGIGGARRGCVARMKGVFTVCRVFCL